MTLPSLVTVAIVAAAAVAIFRETGLLGTTAPMILLRSRDLLSCVRVDVQRTEFLAAFPAPGAATAGTDLEGTRCLESTGKDIVTCGILQCPALTPGTLLRITGHFCVSVSV
jgi:hypothetical protein